MNSPVAVIASVKGGTSVKAPTKGLAKNPPILDRSGVLVAATVLGTREELPVGTIADPRVLGGNEPAIRV
tara:strand:- start:50 stop:259 length:210 start_codon:yes stop_codon:yes gene_type:complete